MDAFKCSFDVTFTDGDSSTSALRGLGHCFQVCFCAAIAESITLFFIKYGEQKERTNKVFPRMYYNICTNRGHPDSLPSLRPS